MSQAGESTPQPPIKTNLSFFFSACKTNQDKERAESKAYSMSQPVLSSELGESRSIAFGAARNKKQIEDEVECKNVKNSKVYKCCGKEKM